MPPVTRATLRFLRRNILTVLVVVLLTGLIVAYASGVRVGPGLSMVRSGTLTLRDLPQGAVVYADERRRAVSAGGDTRIKLVPGAHSVIVDMPRGFPWNDIVVIEDGENRIAHPINVPREPVRRTLQGDELAEARALLARNALPSEDEPLLIAGGCARVTVKNNQVRAQGVRSDSCAPPESLCLEEACLAENIVFAPKEPIRGVIPLPGHDAALLISFGSTVAAIELDPLTPQYFAPVHSGAPALIAPWDKDAFVLAAGEAVYAVSLR